MSEPTGSYPWAQVEPAPDPRDKRISELEAALVALIDAVDAKDATRIENAVFVGKGLTF
jgi:hypothetical protein